MHFGNVNSGPKWSSLGPELCLRKEHFGAFCCVKNRRSNGGIRGPNCRNSIFQKRIFGSDLFQFYGRYFYYKYKLCIRENLEIEGAETRV